MQAPSFLGKKICSTSSAEIALLSTKTFRVYWVRKQGPSINITNMSVDLVGIDKPWLLVPVPRSASFYPILCNAYRKVVPAVQLYSLGMACFGCF